MIPGRRNHLKALCSLATLSIPRLTLGQSNLSDAAEGKLSFGAQQYNFPGGLVDLIWPKTSNELPTVKFGLSEPVVFDQGSSWRCLIGLSLETLPGEYVVYVKENNSELPAFTLRFSVEQKLYPVINSNTHTTDLSPKLRKFSALDFANSVPPELPLQPPVDTQWKDTFGRIFVDEKKDQENSVFFGQNCQSLSRRDLVSNGVLVVVAPQNGIVCNLFASPNRLPGDEASMTLIIDHGRGLFSVLDGVHDLTVELGNGIVRGAVLGKVQREVKENSQKFSRAEWQNENNETTALPRDTLNKGSSEPEHVLFRWYCILNGAYINPLILTKLS